MEVKQTDKVYTIIFITGDKVSKAACAPNHLSMSINSIQNEKGIIVSVNLL